MPLVLHESSSCDVCLNGYSWLTPDNTPHSIPCGHIFCRSCLVNVESSNCPLCRMAFNRERIKKLHVDRPESDAERDLLHRLALAFDAPIIDQISISVELTAWLEGRPEDDHVALRRAWSAFKEYIDLNERKQRDKQKIRRSEHRIRRSERMIQQLNQDKEYDRDMHKAVESSLLTQVSELTAQIADLDPVNAFRNASTSTHRVDSNHASTSAYQLPTPADDLSDEFLRLISVEDFERGEWEQDEDDEYSDSNFSDQVDILDDENNYDFYYEGTEDEVGDYLAADDGLESLVGW